VAIRNWQTRHARAHRMGVPRRPDHGGDCELFAIETARDGRAVEIRALRPDDRAGLTEAVARTSSESLFRRFFAVKKDFTEAEVAYFLNVDFVAHVALVAVMAEDGREVIVGGGRYVVGRPGEAELAFALVDSYQGQGIGSALMRHLAAIGRGAGLHKLTAEVLPDNMSMLRLFARCGLPVETAHDVGVVHVGIRLA